MNSMIAGLWPRVAAPASEDLARSQRIALAQVKVERNARRLEPSGHPMARLVQVLLRVPPRADRAAA